MLIKYFEIGRHSEEGIIHFLLREQYIVFSNVMPLEFMQKFHYYSNYGKHI